MVQTFGCWETTPILHHFYFTQLMSEVFRIFSFNCICLPFYMEARVTSLPYTMICRYLEEFKFILSPHLLKEERA